MKQTRFPTLALAACAAAALLVGPAAQAQNVIIMHSPDASAARAAQQASVDAASRGQRVGMITGRIDPQPEQLPDGTVAQELDASTMMFSVARMGADGRVERLCMHGADNAVLAAKAPDFAQRFTQNLAQNLAQNVTQKSSQKSTQRFSQRAQEPAYVSK